MFNITSLDWTEPTDHVELFAGDMSVTRGELQARARSRNLNTIRGFIQVH